MKCFGFLVRIIVTAKEQCDNSPTRQSVKAGETLQSIQDANDEEFREALRQLIWFIDALMLKKTPVQIVAIQNHTLNHFSHVFEHLKNVFPAPDLGDLARGFLDSIPLANSAQVNHAKLTLVNNLVHSEVFRDATSRTVVMSATVHVLRSHMTRSPQERLLCISILKALLKVVGVKGNEHDVWHMVLMLPTVVPEVLGLQEDAIFRGQGTLMSPAAMSRRRSASDEGGGAGAGGATSQGPGNKELAHLVTCLFTVLRLCAQREINHFMQTVLKDEQERLIFLRQLLVISTQQLPSGTTEMAAGGSLEIFPEPWLLMRMIACESHLKVLEWCGGALRGTFQLAEVSDADLETTLQRLDFDDDSSDEEDEDDDDDDDDDDAEEKGDVESSKATTSLKKNVWFRFFECAITLLQAPVLGLENMDDKRVEFVRRNQKGGDLRPQIVNVLQKAWRSLDNRQRLLFARRLIKPSLQLASNACAEIAAFGCDLYFDLIRGEYAVTGRFSHVESLTVTAIDDLFTAEIAERPKIARERRKSQSQVDGQSRWAQLRNNISSKPLETGGESKADGSPQVPGSVPSDEEGSSSSIKRIFGEILPARFASDDMLNGTAPPTATLVFPSSGGAGGFLAEVGGRLVASPSEFLEEINRLFALLEAHSQFKEVSELEDERAEAMLGLMAYLKKTRRDDMYIRYARKLTNMHLSLSNFAEAGRILEMQANYDFQKESVEAVAGTGYPVEDVASRRARLLKEAVSVYDQGSHWEDAISACQALRPRYEAETFEFDKLSELLREEATLFDRVSTCTDRFWPSFFRVSFYGVGYERDEYVEERREKTRREREREEGGGG